MDGVALEIVAEAEVTQHFEEAEVAQRAADVVEVVVLAAGRTQRWIELTRGGVHGAFSSPAK